GTSAAYPPIVASMIVINPNVPDEAHNHYRRVAREDLRRNVTIADVNAYWAGKAMAFIYAEPIRYVERVVDKATRILRDDRAHDIGTAREYESALPSFRGFYAALSALALVGAVSQIRRIRRDLFLYAFALVQIAVMLVFYVSARQQMVLVVPLVFFACAGLHAMASHRAVAVAGGVAAVLLWLVLMGRSDLTLDDAHRTKGGEQAQRLAEEVASLPASEPIASHPDLAAGVLAAASWVADENAMGNVGQERATQYQAAVAILKEKTPRDFFDEFDLATLELEAGDLPAARERFRALAEMGRLPYRGHWQASSPLFYLGRIAGLEGRNDAAIDYLTRALRETPGDPFVLAELTALDGAPHWRELSDRYYSALDTQLLVAEAMLVQGRAPEAVTDFAKLARSLPRLHRANVGLAASYGAVGEFEKGVEVYRRSLRVNSNPVIWSERISTLFRGWARENRDDPAVQFEAARMLFFHGRFEEALGLVAVLAPVGGGAVEPAIANFEQNVRRTLAVIPD
ncbi:MAG: tetratricopeptide (TPR) repeat protein, partial [Myxococcota bacterium]